MVERPADPSEPDPASTRWSRVQEGDIDYLVQRYRSPLFRWFRSRLPSDEIAEDATQDFLVQLIEKKVLSAADPARGRFRSLLFELARRFLVDLHRTRLAAKRGGDRAHDPLPEPLLADSKSAIPQVEFDRLWFLSLVNRARRAVKEHSAAAGKPEYYEAFHRFYFQGEGTKHMPIDRIAAEMNASVTEVNNFLRRAREAYGRAMRSLIAEYCPHAEALEEEIRDLSRLLDRRPLDAPDSTSVLEPPPPGTSDPGDP